MLTKHLRIGKEQWCVPPEQYQPGDSACLRMTDYVMIALHAIDASQYSTVGSPGAPDEGQQGKPDRYEDALNDSQQRNSKKTDN